MTNGSTTPPPAPAVRSRDLTAFFEETPVLELRDVEVVIRDRRSYPPREIVCPPVTLYCPAPSCRRTGAFDCRTTWGLSDRQDAPEWDNRFIEYLCRNCQTTLTIYAVQFRVPTVGLSGKSLIRVLKVGEYPRFGEMRANPIGDVLKDEIEYFERGYRSETDGLGIGAFAYYRRFVESHKDKIIQSIKDVAKAQGAKPDVIAALDRALATNSFERAVEAVKDAIPESLRYSGGHNPLTLLHSALSSGLHSDDDVECLALARDIRLLLTDLAERTTAALKNQDELGQAVNRLLAKTAAKAPKQNP